MHHMQTQKHGISKLDFASIVSALWIILIVKRYDVCVCFCFFYVLFFVKTQFLKWSQVTLQVLLSLSIFFLSSSFSLIYCVLIFKGKVASVADDKFSFL